MVVSAEVEGIALEGAFFRKSQLVILSGASRSQA
jgi:hypothetical protein